jgi:hypothetical protein
MYIYRNTETRSRNNFCREKAKNIYSETVFVASGIQHKMRMRLSGSTIFFHIIS